METPYKINHLPIRYIFSILIPFILFPIMTIYAQEICDNGIDDDSDGLVDCFDPECEGSAPCDGFFFPLGIVNIYN